MDNIKINKSCNLYISGEYVADEHFLFDADNVNGLDIKIKFSEKIFRKTSVDILLKALEYYATFTDNLHEVYKDRYDTNTAKKALESFKESIK